jgi:hypothetical protein
LRFTVYHLQFTVRLPFALHSKRLTANAWRMVNRKRLAALLILLVSNSLSLAIGNNTLAQSNASPQGITVSPAFQMVQIPAGASQQPITFTITNNQPVAQKLDLSVADFNTLNESGGLFFVGTNPTALQKQYGLAKWVSLPANTVTVPARQTYKFQASILNLPTLSAGGHYGALMIALDNGTKPGSNQVGLHPIASSLLFVTKLDGATYNLSLADVQFKHSLFSLPGNVTLRFQNTGNTHLIPRGVVTITGSKGQLVSKGIINPNSSVILPQAYRRYPITLHQLASAGNIGKYNLRVDFRFDGFDQFRSYQTNFWILPSYILGLIILIILVLGLGVWFVKKRVHKKAQK